MESILLVGVLCGTGIYLLLSGNLLRLLFGFILLSNGANLLVLLMSGPPDGKSAPLSFMEGQQVDPLPQALLLTAIVISFGTTAYLIFLLYRLYLDHGTLDVRRLFSRMEHQTADDKKEEGK